jgi:hypothetical protein
MAGQPASALAEPRRVFGRTRIRPKMFCACLYARVAATSGPSHHRSAPCGTGGAGALLSGAVLRQYKTKILDGNILRLRVSFRVVCAGKAPS